MTNNNLSNRHIMQTAFVTTDIERSVRDFGKTFNIGGWAIIRKVAFNVVTLRGAPCHAGIRAAVAFQGDMMYEFIQPLDDLPSVYRSKTSNALDVGFHHLAYVVPDLKAAIVDYEAEGYSIAMRCTLGDGEAAYMEQVGSSTGMIELLEAGPGVDAFISGTAALQAPLTNGEVQITYW